MGVTTWLDRITDESNLWLSATKAEEAKDFQSAAALYLEDATDCVRRGSRVRAALSCYCAADCLSRSGTTLEAKRLFQEAGRMYSTIADHGVSGSIREGIWALQRAYGCYILAGDLKESEAVHESFRLLARRANPFERGSPWLEMPKVQPAFDGGPEPKRVEPTGDAKAAMSKFLDMRTHYGPDWNGGMPRSKRVGGMSDESESFVSQLG
ncbi:MAG: hypothetical protein KGI38_08040 [Thaumarchaeota archaeon]|nr:hypothetical protein [Nitrososphaerota archaeon]